MTSSLLRSVSTSARQEPVSVPCHFTSTPEGGASCSPLSRNSSLHPVSTPPHTTHPLPDRDVNCETQHNGGVRNDVALPDVPRRRVGGCTGRCDLQRPQPLDGRGFRPGPGGRARRCGHGDRGGAPRLPGMVPHLSLIHI